MAELIDQDAEEGSEYHGGEGQHADHPARGLGGHVEAGNQYGAGELLECYDAAVEEYAEQRYEYEALVGQDLAHICEAESFAFGLVVHSRLDRESFRIQRHEHRPQYASEKKQPEPEYGGAGGDSQGDDARRNCALPGLAPYQSGSHYQGERRA